LKFSGVFFVSFSRNFTSPDRICQNYWPTSGQTDVKLYVQAVCTDLPQSINTMLKTVLITVENFSIHFENFHLTRISSFPYINPLYPTKLVIIYMSMGFQDGFQQNRL